MIITSVRKLTLLAAGAMLAITAAAHAQAPTPLSPPAQPPAAQTPPTAPPPAAAPQAQTVQIIAMAELPEATQQQVNTLVEARSDEDAQRFRASLEAAPQVVSELRNKGMDAGDVLAASVGNDGTVILVTADNGN